MRHLSAFTVNEGGGQGGVGTEIGVPISKRAKRVRGGRGLPGAHGDEGAHGPGEAKKKSTKISFHDYMTPSWSM